MSVERAAKQGCVGSGKRRALLLASQFSFKEIIGVELSPSLHRIAYSNIQIYRDDFQRCRKIRSICGDAAKYQIPPEKAVFYLFNPFDEEVMHMVLSNIEKSLHRVPREIYVIYLKPLHRDVLDQAKFLKAVSQSDRYVIYAGGPRLLS
jgi:hypothetical protein